MAQKSQMKKALLNWVERKKATKSNQEEIIADTLSIKAFSQIKQHGKWVRDHKKTQKNKVSVSHFLFCAKQQSFF